MCKPPEHTLIGRSEGERQATLKIARTMLQNGIDRNTVMKMTGLTEDDWHKSATNPPFLALSAGPSVKTGGPAGRHQTQAQPASHSDLTVSLSQLKEFALSLNYRSSERIISYFSNYSVHASKITGAGKDAKFPSRITYNQKVTRSNVHDEIVRLIRKSLDNGYSPENICVLAPQWVLLASTTRKLVAMLPDQQFDGPGLIPFSNNFDNFWFKVSKVLLTDSSPALLIRRLRWANEVIKDLDSFGVDTKTLTPRILLRESNALTVNELDGLRYLDQAFTELLKRLNISPEIHPALLTHREAFFSSSAARIERLQKEGATYINQISVFKKVFRERSGITVSTIHGVKGAEFDVVIAFGLLEGMVPHFNEVNGHVAASKLLYVLSSRARKNLHLISESERQRGRYSSYSATELLAACIFNYDEE